VLSFNKMQSRMNWRNMKLRIATYNIHKGVTSFRSRPRIHALKQALSKLDAELFFLQEVQGRHDLLAARHATDWADAQHSYLAGDSHAVAYGMNAIYDHGHHGNALLSSHPIASSTNHDVSDHAYESRGILHCVVQTPKADVHCYVIHLGLFAGGRRRQAESLIAAVNSSAPHDTPVIIAGDFNDWGNHLSETLRKRLGVKEVFDAAPSSQGIAAFFDKLSGRMFGNIQPARTFPAMLPFLQLDRIYVRGFEVESAEVLYGKHWAKLSDHAPIVATLRLK
jgi:endonuclease/exonuclease/phosphatase family metal-dependent hydrolase